MKKKILLILILFLFFGLRSYRLGFDMLNSDGGRWHRRSENFLIALKSFDFSSTYQHYQPGVTLMWINSPVKQAIFSYQMLTTGEPKTLENSDFFPVINFYSKITVVFVLSLLLLTQILVISKLFNWKIALMYGFLMSVEPYVLGIDRWFHLTSLETYFAFTSFLVFLLWVENKNLKLLSFSGVLFSLSVLSKLTSLILAPLFLIFLASDYLKSRKAKYILIFFFSFLVTFIVLFPAVIIQPLSVLQKLFSAVSGAVGDDIRQYEITGMLSYFYYLIILAFKLSPFTFGLLIYSMINRKEGKVKYIFYYIFMYLVFLTFAAKKIDRYSLVLIPPIVLLVANSLFLLKKNLRIFILSLIVSFSIWFYQAYVPVFSSYYSPIFGGTAKALEIGVYENSGEYFADTAYYLNLKGRDKITAVPNNIEPFSYFYKGNISREINDEVDYLVMSLDLDRKSVEVPSECVYEKSFGADLDVVFVYKCDF